MQPNAPVSNNVPNALPKILVGCPTCDLKADALDKFMQGLDALTYTNYDVVLEDNSATPHYSEKLRELGKKWEAAHPGHSFRVLYSGQVSEFARARLVHGRNLIRDIALNENYDYFFSLEQDVVCPPNILERFIAYGVDVVSGTYMNQKTHKDRPTEIKVMAGIFANEEERKEKTVREMGFFHLFPSRLIEVAYAGVGCMLISRRALAMHAFRYIPDQLACDDVYFCMDLWDKNIPIYVDSSTLCAHYFNDAFLRTKV